MKRVKQFVKQSGCRVNFFFYVHPHIKGDLVVATPARMQPSAGFPDARDKLGLDKGMYILGVHVYFQNAVFYIRQNALKRFDYRLGILFWDNPLFAQHLRVGYTARYILPVKP
jgi:hypothetical protein